MKKLYTLLAVALTAASMSAQTLYFKGAGEGLSWEEGVDLAVNPENGVYTVKVNNLSEFKVSTFSSTGGWDGETGYNAGALYAAGLDKEENLGKAMPAEINGGFNNATPWAGDYTIVVAGNVAAGEATITLTTTTPKPEGYTAIYLRGGMNNWLNDATPEDMATWEMKTNDGKVYWFDCTGATVIPAGTEFKIADANWSAINYSAGDEIVPFDEPLPWTYNNPTNGLMSEAYEGTIKLDLVDGPRKDALVTVYTTLSTDNPFGAVENVVVDSNATAEYFNLQGLRVANPENGLFIVRRGNTVSKVLVK